MSRKNPSGKATRTHRVTAMTFTNRYTKATNKRFTMKPPPTKFINKFREPSR